MVKNVKLKLALVTSGLGAIGLSIAVYTGCFSPNYLNGGFGCGDTGECPSGYQCITGLCWAGGITPDARPPIVGAMTVSVFDHNSGLPQPGVKVVFDDPMGHVIATVTTDANGQATQNPFTQGGSVTVAQQDSVTMAPRELVTILDVTPGQTINIGRQAKNDVTDYVNFSATIPPASPATATATSYFVDAGCTRFDTQPGTTLSGILAKSCTRQPNNTFTLIAYAVDNNNRNVAYSVLKDIPIPPASPIAFDAWHGTAEFQMFQINASNAPLAITPCFQDAGTGSCGSVQVSPYVGPQHFGNSDQNTAFNISPGGSASVTMLLPRNAFDSITYQVQVSYGTSSGVFERSLVPPAASDSVDLTAQLLPPVHPATVDTSNLSHPVVSWTADAPLSTLIAEIGVSWDQPNDAGSNTSLDWAVFGPGTVASPYRFPDLPSDVAAWLPQPGAVFQSPAAFFGNVSLYKDYDTFMNQGGVDLLLNNDGLPGNVPFTAVVDFDGSGK